MNNKALIITSIVILSILAIFLTIFLVFGITGKYDLFSNHIFGTKSKNIIYDKEYELESIQSLEVISSAGDVDIFESEDDSIRIVVYGQNENDLNVSFNNGNLKIDVSEFKRKWISFGFYINDVIVYLPRNYDKQINLDVDYGDISIANFENASMNINEDCGSVKIEKAKDAIIKNSYGDVKINTILNKCDIEMNCGDIDIQKLEIKENSSIKCDLGDIKIKEVNNVYIDAKVDLGDIKIDGSDRHSEITLTLKNSCGDIKVNK